MHPILSQELLRALQLGVLRKWRALQRAGMRKDYSWDHSAAEYVKLYRRLLRRRD